MVDDVLLLQMPGQFVGLRLPGESGTATPSGLKSAKRLHSIACSPYESRRDSAYIDASIIEVSSYLAMRVSCASQHCCRMHVSFAAVHAAAASPLVLEHSHISWMQCVDAVIRPRQYCMAGCG